MRARRRVAQVVIGAVIAVSGFAPAPPAGAAATVVHAPPAVADYAHELVLDAAVRCDAACEGTLYYKAPGEAPSPLSTFTAAPMEATAVAGGPGLRGVVPAAAVDTRGVEYLIAVNDGGAVTWWPAAPVSPALATGFRVRVPEPPHVVHAPAVTAYRGQALALEASSNCVHAFCTGVVEWRTTGQAWSTTAMDAEHDPSTGRMAYTASLPSEAASTEGMDYRIRVSDGHVTDETPTYHVTVLTPTAIIHRPVVTALYGQPMPIEAVVACAATTCTVELSYRTTGTGLLADGAWTTVAMETIGGSTPVAGATSVQRWYREIPVEAVTTRGIDYRIRATDGHTTAHSPGTAYTGTTNVQSDGGSTYWYHVHVAEPVRVAHVPVVHAPYREAIAITAQVNCSTGACSATLGYRTSTGLDTVAGVLDYAGGGGPFAEIPMEAELLVHQPPAGKVLQFAADIPAEAVDTNGVDYWISVTDGHTTAVYPGTSYVGGIGSLDGTRVAWQHVEVSTRPVVVHVPPASYTQGVATSITAIASVGTATTPTATSPTATSPTATLWARHAPAGTYAALPLTVAPGAAGTWDLTGEIPASMTAVGAPIEYVIEVDDGHQRGFAPVTAAAPVEPMVGYRIVVNAPVSLP